MSHLAGVLAARHSPGLTLVTEHHPGMGHTELKGATVVRGSALCTRKMTAQRFKT